MSQGTEAAYHYTLRATGSQERYLLLGTTSEGKACVLLRKNLLRKWGMTRRYMRHLPPGGMTEYYSRVTDFFEYPWFMPFNTILGVPVTGRFANLQETLGTPWPLIVSRMGRSATHSLTYIGGYGYTEMTTGNWIFYRDHSVTKLNETFSLDKGDRETFDKLFKLILLNKMDAYSAQ